MAACAVGGMAESKSGSLHIENRFLLGLFFMSAWTMVLAMSGWLDFLPVVAPLVILPCVTCFQIWRDRKEMIRNRVKIPRGKIELAGAILCAAALAASTLMTAAPPTLGDALIYHVGIPRQYLLHGGMVSISSQDLTLYFQQAEMVLLPLLALDATGRAANLLGIPVLAALAANLGRLAGRAGGGRSGWLTASAVLTSPVLMALSAYTKNDLLAISAAAGSIRLSMEMEKGDPKFAARCATAGFLAGCSLAVKPSTALILLPWGVILAWKNISSLKAIAIFAGTSCIMLAPWIARNLVIAGVPWSSNYTLQAAASPAAVWTTLPECATHLLESFYTVHPEFDGPLGPLLLALVMLAPLAGRESPSLRPLLLAGASGYLLWIFIGGYHARFFLPVLLPLVAIGSVSRIARQSVASAIALGLAALSLASGVILLERSTGFLELQTGRVGTEEFLARNMESYVLQRESSRLLPEDAVVAMVGEPRIFTMMRRVQFDLSWRRETALDLAHPRHDPRELKESLKGRGATHVLFNPVLLRRSLDVGGKPGLLCPRDMDVFREMLEDSRLCEVILRDGAGPGMGLYRLR